MTKPCPPDLAAFKHEPADYEQPVEAVTVEQLKPCPNPWCDHSEGCKVWASYGRRWRVGCIACGFDGPAASTEAQAIAAWNTRTHEAMREALEAIRDFGFRHPGHGHSCAMLADAALSGDSA